MQTFQKLIESFKSKTGWSNLELAKRAAVSSRAICEALDGTTDCLAQKKGVTKKKLIGVTASTQRLLRVIGEDDTKWLEQLGLTAYVDDARPRSYVSVGKIGDFQYLMNETITETDLELLRSARSGLGDVFTLEIALKVLANAKS